MFKKSATKEVGTKISAISVKILTTRASCEDLLLMLTMAAVPRAVRLAVSLFISELRKETVSRSWFERIVARATRERTLRFMNSWSEMQESSFSCRMVYKASSEREREERF